MASCIIGCVGGYCLGMVSVNEMATGNEMKGDYKFMWKECLGFISVSLVCVYIGTKLCLQMLRNKPVASILKGL